MGIDIYVTFLETDYISVNYLYLQYFMQIANELTAEMREVAFNFNSVMTGAAQGDNYCNLKRAKHGLVMPLKISLYRMYVGYLALKAKVPRGVFIGGR